MEWVSWLWDPTSPQAIYIPRGYALVLMVVVHNWLVLLWQALQVGKARKTYNVKYPTLYEQKDNSQFNLVQRAHQNSLEWNPAFLIFLLLGGIAAPVSSAFAGFLYNYGRIVFARGYYNGSPHKGMWGFYGLFYLIATTCWTAYRIALAT